MPIVEINGKKVWVPAGSTNTPGTPTKPNTPASSNRQSTRKSTRQGSNTGTGFEADIARLEGIALNRDLQLPEQSKTISAISGLAGFLNTPTAIIAGATRGLARDDMSVLEGIKQGVQNRKTFGFGDVLREDFGVGSKVASGAGGLALDIALDPLNLLSFGTLGAAKLGTKTLSKTAQKTAQEIAQRELPAALRASTKSPIESLTEFYGSTEKVERAIASRLPKGTNLFDEGGIKIGQKSIVSSEQLSKIADKIGIAKVASSVPVQLAKDAFGKAFVADYGLPENFVKIKDKLTRDKQNVVNAVVKNNRQLFEGISDDEARTFFDSVFAKKTSVIKKQEAIEEDAIKKLNELYPSLRVTNTDDARRTLDALEEITEREISALRQKVDDIVRPIFDARARAVDSEELLNPFIRGLQETPGLRGYKRVDELTKLVGQLKQELSAFKKGSGERAAQSVGDGNILEKEEVINVHNKIIQFEEERLLDKINDLEDRLNAMRSQADEAGSNLGRRPQLPRATPAEKVVLIEREIQELVTSFDDKNKLLSEAVNARRAAKAQLREEKLTFDNPKLQELADTLFEGKNAVVAKMARDAGIPLEDAIKFYVPSKFRSRVDNKSVAPGSSPMSAPALDFQKLFTGYTGDDLIRDPFEAYTRGQIDVANARLKSGAIRKILDSFGLPENAFPSEQAAKLRGYKKYERKTIDGEVSGWLPKELIEDVNKMMEPKNNIIDDLAKASGFDYVTGITKSYFTSLFPAFHARNITGNEFQLALEFGAKALDPKVKQLSIQIIRGTNPNQVIKFPGGKEYTVGQIKNELQEKSNFFTQTGAFSRAEQAMEQGTGALSRTESGRFNPLSRNNLALRGGRAVGGFFEEHAKVAGVLAGLNRGESMEQAIKSTERALFDYGKLTDFERTVMRRLIPFYTFMRKNAEFQLTTLLTKPARTAAQFKTVRGVGDTVFEPVSEEDTEGLPSFLREGVGFKLPGENKYGQEQFVAGLGLPIEEFFGRFSGEQGILWNAMKSVVEGANPSIKFPLERITGVDIFRGRPITEVTNANDFNSMIDSMPEGVAEQFKEWIDYREIKDVPVYKNGVEVGTRSRYVADPYKLHFFRNLPTSRFFSTAGVAGDTESTTATKALRIFTGAKPYAIDEEEQKFYKDLERKRQLEDYLIRMGVVGRFQNVFEKD